MSLLHGKTVSAGKSNAGYCLLFQSQKRNLIHNCGKIILLWQHELLALFSIFINLYFYILTFLCLEDVGIHYMNPSLMFIKVTSHHFLHAFDPTIFLIYIILLSGRNRPLRILPCIHI